MCNATMLHRYQMQEVKACNHSMYKLGQPSLSCFQVAVDLFPSWLVWGRNQIYLAFFSTQTSHKPVFTSTSKQTAYFSSVYNVPAICIGWCWQHIHSQAYVWTTYVYGHERLNDQSRLAIGLFTPVTISQTFFKLLFPSAALLGYSISNHNVDKSYIWIFL